LKRYRVSEFPEDFGCSVFKSLEEIIKGYTLETLLDCLIDFLRSVILQTACNPLRGEHPGMDH
jgi:hypothetical protein